MNLILGATNAVRAVLGRIGQLIAFKFDATKVTFTPAMAKRNSAGPFAAGVLVQGKVADASGSDYIMISRGTAIQASFFTNIDAYQGSIVLWITPEWNGNDGLTHKILYDDAYAGLNLQKLANGNLLFRGTGVAAATVSVAAWTAGTTYCVVCRWDSRNTLDGTNYFCLSVNDVHTFGVTTGFGVSPQRMVFSNASTQSANALIEGLTIYRRVLYDGTYGIDAGNGDEISLIYNAGSGADPCSITGSWDVTFCLPTNATAGALTTGTGEAWSHPHGSEALADAFCQTAYADSAWEDVGTPVTPVSVAVSASNKMNCGSEATIDNLFSGEVTLEGWFRNAATSVTSYGLMGKCASSSTGWLVFFEGSGALQVRVCNTVNTYASVSSPGSMRDNRWHHFAVYYNEAGDKYVYLAVDGIWYKSATAFSGTHYDDAALDLLWGAGNWTMIGSIGWARISNNARYTPGTNFVPPSRTSPPANDANTVRLFYMNEGAGTTITDYSTNAQNGTLSNGTWNTTRDLATDAPGERVYNWGYATGNDAADEGISQTLSDLTAGADYVIRPVLHYDPNAVPIVKVLDATNGDAVITSLTCPNQQTNLVTNGGFDSDAAGWTAGASATLSSVAGGISGNALQVQNGAASQGYAYQSIQLAPYATYRLTWWHKNGAAQGKVSVGTAPGGTQVYSGSNTNDAVWAQYTTTFNSGATGLVFINLWQGSATNGQNTLFDSIILTRVIDSKRPFCESMAFSLPTVAREGVGADCTSVKIQVINSAATGTIAVHQVEVI